mgnify:CR=1 FL=1
MKFRQPYRKIKKICLTSTLNYNSDLKKSKFGNLGRIHQAI